LHLSWLQSSGYDWFEHFRPRVKRDDQKASSSDETADFAFSMEDAEAPPSHPAEQDNSALQTPLLMGKAPGEDLPMKQEGVVLETVPDDLKPLSVVVPEQSDSPHLLDNGPTISGAEPADLSEQLSLQDQGPSEHTLNTWEIPDQAPSQGSKPDAASQPSSSRQESILEAEIDYDFSAFDIEAAPEDLVDAETAEPSLDKTPDDSTQTPSSGQGDR